MDAIKQQKVLALPRVQQIGKFWSVKKIPEKPSHRLQQIHTWFTDERIKTLLLPLNQQHDRLSLRALDWLVTNYAKKHNIVLADEQARGPPLNVYGEYRTMLTFWRRKNFDMFRRHQRIYFYWTDPATPNANRVLEETTVAQLNFLHWAEISGVIKYARNNVEAIEKDMAQCMAEVKKLKKQDKISGVKRKRRELSKAPKVQCYVYPIKMQVKLNADEL